MIYGDSERDNNVRENNTLLKFKDSVKSIEELNQNINCYKNIIEKQFNYEIKRFYQKYSNKILLKRFSIGIFGKLSSGKSTFWNYSLGLNDILECKSEVATKFICIIRHKKENKNPRYFQAEIKNRTNINENEEFFNFEKGEEIRGNIMDIIAKRNEEITNIENNPEILNERQKYFLIVEANLTIFNVPDLEKYADIFEFLDIPGLDEGDLTDNRYIRDLLPMIIPNLAFSIFIFDSKHMEDVTTQKIIKLIVLEMIKKSNENLNEDLQNFISEHMSKEMALNSIYIINKIDEERMDQKDQKINIAKTILKDIYNEQNIFSPEIFNNIIPISAKSLLFEQNKLNDFYFFLGDAFMKYQKSDKEFKSYLLKKLKEISLNKKKHNVNDELPEIKDNEDDDSSIDSTFSNSDDEEVNEEEFNNLSQSKKKNINELICEIKKICENFSIKDYLSFKKRFAPKNENNNLLYMTKDIYSLIHKIMSNIVNNFNNLKEFENLSLYLEREVNEECQLISLSKKLISKCQNENNFNHNPLAVLRESENIYKEDLSKIKGIEIVKRILDMSNSQNKIFDERVFLYYLLVGQMSSGKSTFINTMIIGNDLLPTDSRECTKIGIILNHIDNIEESAIYKAKLVQYKETQKEDIDIENDDIEIGNGKIKYYFDYDKDQALVKGIDNIKLFINQANDNHSENDIDFYLIKMPLKLYDFIGDERQIGDLKYKIQFIDFPGLDTKFEAATKAKNCLLQMINGFIYTNMQDTLNSEGNKNILKGLIENIRQRDPSTFNFKSCLFLMISENDKDSESFRKELNKIINNIQNIYSNGTNPNNDIKNNDIKIIKFSNFKFKSYLEDCDLLLNEESFCKKLNEISSKEQLKDFYNTIKNKIEKIKIEIPKEKKDDLINLIKNNIISTNIKDSEKKNYSERISKYFYYIKNNPKELLNYKTSGFDNLKICLTESFYDSIKFYEKILKILLAKHFLSISREFIFLKSLFSKEKSSIDREYFLDENNLKIEKRKLKENFEKTTNSIKKKFIKCEENINRCISSLYNYSDNTRNDFLKKEKFQIKNAEEQYNVHNKKINTILNNMLEVNNKQINDILSHTEKKSETQIINNLKCNDKIEAFTHCEKNFLAKALDIAPVAVLHAIPVINLGAYAVTLIGGIIDHFRDHSEEYEKEIISIKDQFNSNISDNRRNIISKINNIYYTYYQQINNIFYSFGKDLEKILDNDKWLKKIIVSYEEFLKELLI